MLCLDCLETLEKTWPFASVCLFGVLVRDDLKFHAVKIIAYFASLSRDQVYV